MKTNILPIPRLALANGGSSECDQNALRRLPIQKAVRLGRKKWIMAYDKNRHYQDAEHAFTTMVQASEKLGIVIEEPEWFELDREDNIDQFSHLLKGYIQECGQPLIVVIILRAEYLYAKLKTVCYKNDCISQVVQAKTCKRMNLSVATNVIKQINSKLGGDLYNINFEKEISPNTMLIGIDVCHQGESSIVGFCASINQEMSQYCSQKILQKRGQEIVNKDLTTAFKSSLNTYVDRHPKKLLPDHFIIYRDGVGDAMRRQVLQKEISQFREAIDEMYNKAAKKPKMTLIIVNKRITQRFFVEDE